MTHKPMTVGEFVAELLKTPQDAPIRWIEESPVVLIEPENSDKIYIDLPQ